MPDALKFTPAGTAYREAGQGPVVVLIHGVGLDQSMWAQVSESLSEQYRVIRYDMLGHGQSPLHPGAAQLADFSAQLLEVLDALCVERACIIGFSMGGLVAQQFALLHPQRCERLVVVSSVFDRTPEQRTAVLERVEQVRTAGIASTVDAAIQRWFSDEYRERYPEDIQQLRDQLRANDPSGYLQAYTVFATADAELRGGVCRITCPTLVVTGEHDLGSTPDMAHELARAVPNAQSVIVAGQRHMLPVEGSATFSAVVKQFLMPAPVGVSGGHTR